MLQLYLIFYDFEKKRVFAYYDGSNFYHHPRSNYGITRIDFYDMTNELVNLSKEELKRIKYFNCPINQQENPVAYSKQQKFFQKVRATALTQVYLGNLVKRPLKRININCNDCGHQKVEDIECPGCNSGIRINDSSQCYKFLEKGVDVKLATELLLDGIDDKYDVALLFSSDADYVPAIKYVVKKLNKEVVYCHFPQPKTNELHQNCSESRLITKATAQIAEFH